MVVRSGSSAPPPPGDARSFSAQHEQIRRTHRQRAKQTEFQQTYRAKRPLVERSIAWLTRGNRRLRYRGVVKNNAWLHHRVAALNLRRLLTFGLTLTNGTWALA